MRYIFGSSETENINDFIGQIQKYLLEESNEWIDDKSTLENFQPQNFEEYFRFLYLHYEEDFIKYHISSYFDIMFFDEINENENELNDSNIITEYIEEYQKYNFLLYKHNDKIKIVLDLPSERLFKWIEDNINTDIVEISFAKKNNIIHKIQSTFKKELIKFSINPNHKNKYSPSASDIKSSSKSTLIVGAFIFAFFILMSFKSALFALIVITLANLTFLTSILYKLFLSSVPNKNNLNNEEYCYATEQNLNSKVGEEIEENQNFPPYKIQDTYKPIYTILLPLYKEEKSIIFQLISAIKNFNYPQHQLDVKILLEENDAISETIFSSIKLDYNFDLIVVPDGEKYGHPQTKARACNYGFNFSKGEYLVIYDSDNIPHPNQISNSICEFTKNKDLSCIQYTLQPYNHNENLLTQFYSIEFDLWYKVFLKSIEKLHLPITFGGTSNHFRITNLQNNLWDPYNVTEDADLGIRWWLNKDGEVKIIDLPTTEEAPISIKAWLNQRSRWIKGFMQTYVVHYNYKFNNTDERKTIFKYWMNLFIALPIVSQILIIPSAFEFLILKFVHHKQNILSLLGNFTLISFIISCILMILPVTYNKNKILSKIKCSIIIFPIYSIFLNAISCYKAAWQFFVKPFYWEKTIHGVTNIKNIDNT
jgi:cellulose synthase/poly-beta-1,6-N-acetylglucosamine synthase-like glycosyltransferase